VFLFGIIYVMSDLFKYDSKTGGSKGLVFIGEKTLVYKRDGNTKNYPFCIDLPGGGPEPNETPFETFKREVMEEFGLDIEPEQIVYYKKYPSRLEPGKVAYFPVARLSGAEEKNIRFGNEGLEYLLVSLDELLQFNDFAWPYMKDRVRDYLGSRSS